MPRALRTDFPGAWHHVMNRGAAQRTIFYTDADRQLFMDCLHEAFTFAKLELHGYCIMGNHYHLLVRSLDGQLPEGMRRLSGKFTNLLNKREGTDGSRFRGRYTSVLIEDDAHLLQVSRYIHLNPVDAGLVRSPGDWAWSTFSAYANEANNRGLLLTERILEMFGAQSPRDEYRRFVIQTTSVERAARGQTEV